MAPERLPPMWLGSSALVMQRIGVPVSVTHGSKGRAT
jgi:hypothetical protein